MHTHTSHTHTHIYTHTHAHTHTSQTHVHTHTYMHTQTHHTNTHTQTHIHMYRNSMKLMQSSSYIHSIIVVIMIIIRRRRRRRRRMVVGKNSIVSCHRLNSIRAPPSPPLEPHGRHRKGMVFAQTHRKCMTRSQERDCTIYIVGQHQQKYQAG